MSADDPVAELSRPLRPRVITILALEALVQAALWFVGRYFSV